MTAEIFWKKRIRLVVTGILSTSIIVCALIYACMLLGVQKIVLAQSFHFIAFSTEHVEAGAHFVTQSGGAGYVMENEGAQCIVFSVYLKEKEAHTVQASLKDYGEETGIFVREVGTLYVKNTDKRSIQEIKGAFSSLYGCIEVLQGEITRLDKGATQQSAKRVLTTLKGQFGYLKKIYQEKYSTFSKICERAEMSLEQEIRTTVFVKNLRYLQCELCVSYLDLAKEFVL